jgi:hypothetical protein
MNDTGASTEHHRLEAVKPSDPVMAASDPGMFAPLTSDEAVILYEHLNSGRAKQGAVYEPASELWKDTLATLGDLLGARQAAMQADREAEAGQ